MASSTKSADGNYVVFLSFCGKDTRQGFISHLYDALCAVKVKTFIDEDLPKGDRIHKIFEVIREARIHIVVYSTNYASSKWCLDELAEIMKCLKCMSNGERYVLPVFYKVNPSTDIKGQNSITHDHLQNHEVTGKSSMAVAIWKAALIDLAGIAGWHFETGAESKLVKDIVSRVSSLLQRKSEGALSNSFFRFFKEAGDRLTIDLKSNLRSNTNHAQREVMFEVKNQQFTPTEVWKITANFKTVIRECTFGKIFKGTILGGVTVAVKELPIMQQLGRINFLAEAKILSFIHHKNLVHLVGYCVDAKRNKGYLVCEFMGNGSLQQHLSNEMTPNILSWDERLSIARDVARGLCYLHDELGIIHGDLNCSNILLSWDLEAKIAEFGFAKTFDAENMGRLGPINIIATATVGYLDPQVHIGGRLNKRTDVYSFGMVLFKLITGHEPSVRINSDSLVPIYEWVGPLIDRRDIKSIVDPRLNGKFSIDVAWKVIEIAVSCVMSPAHRPQVALVLAALDECCSDNATHTMGPYLPLP